MIIKGGNPNRFFRMTIEWEGVDWRGYVLFLKGGFGNVGYVVFRRLAPMIESTMQRRAPVRSGWLRDNINVIEFNAFGFTIISKAFYSFYVDQGTRKMRARRFFGVTAIEFRARLSYEFANEFRRQVINTSKKRFKQVYS